MSKRKQRDPGEDLAAHEKAALMDLLWESMSDAQQAAWLGAHRLEYANLGGAA